MSRSTETVKCSEMMEECLYAAGTPDHIRVCDYIGVTGKRRGCDPEHCDKFKPNTPTKVKDRFYSTEKMYFKN